jgi:DNA-binding transcriptional LysR family regulator
MDLLAIADFNLVAAHGGVGRASRASGRPKATLSRRVAELEESLGVRLFERGRRNLRLTEEGRALHERTTSLLTEIAHVTEDIGSRTKRPRGRLRVSAPSLFSDLAMGRIAAGFASAYPDVRLEVIAEDRLVDLIEEGYDLAIRVNPHFALLGSCRHCVAT